MNTLDAACFVLLGAAIPAVWWPPVYAKGRRAGGVAPWAICLALAIAAGFAGGVLDPLAVPALILLAAVAGWRIRAPHGPWPVILLGALALALALHALPGFHSRMLLDRVQVSPGAPPFSLYANFDKALAGLLLLALCCKRCRSWREAGKVCRRSLPLAVIGIACVLGVAWGAGLIGADPKLTNAVPVFVVVNLLFTCVPEEAFFRGLIQERLMRAAQARRWAPWLPVVISAVLFGAVHAGGGWLYALMATLAGLVNGWAYAVTRRIEPAILSHFALNAVHFVFFTYPRLA